MSGPRRLALAAVLAAACLLLLPSFAPAAPPGPAKVVANASGRYDTLVLRDLGGKQAAVVQMVAADGAFTAVELWRSAPGAFDVKKATFVAGDVNGDGIADGIALVDLGRGRSQLVVFGSDGRQAEAVVAWTSKPGAFARAKVKLTVGDVNGDGRDDLLALYPRGRSGAVLYRFLSDGASFTQSAVWSAAKGLPCSRAQLAAGDANGDGRDDAVVLAASSARASRLYVFVAGEQKFAKKTFWSGAYAFARARLAAGDADSDGRCDAICLYRAPDDSGRLDVFRSSGTAFAGPAAWYDGAGPLGRLPWAGCGLAAGDVTGDGRSDAVLTRPTGGASAALTTCVSAGSAFEPQDWWRGAWAAAAMRTAVAPSPGLVVADGAEVLSASSMRSLRRVESDGTLTFAALNGQLARLERGDVVLQGASPEFPEGVCRTVTAVREAGGRVVVETEPAALADVIDEGEVAFDLHVTADDLADDGIRAPGVAIDRTPGPVPGTLPAFLGTEGEGLHFTLTGTVLGFAEGEGDIWLDPNAYCDWHLGWGGLEWAYYTQELNATADLSLSCKQDFTGTKERTIYKRTLSVITIVVGVVPVVVTPVFEVKLGVEGEITAGVTLGMTVDASASVGITYDDEDGWDPSAGATATATPHRPQLFGELTLTGYASGGLAFEIYGVAGPEAALKPYVELAADVGGDPWWTLTGGLKGVVGFKVEALDTEVFSEEFELDLWSEELDHAGTESSGGGPSDYHTPSIRGRILDQGTSAPVMGATVEVEGPGGSAQTTSAADGSYVFFGLAPGTYTVSADADRYSENSRSSTVAEGQTTMGQDVRLTRFEDQGIQGHVYEAAGGYPMFLAHVDLYERAGAFLNSYRTDLTYADGSYKLEDVDPGTYELIVTDEYDWYYFPERRTVTVTAGQLRTEDFTLVAKTAQGVSGWVVENFTHEPLADVIVQVRDAGGESYLVEDSVVTGADGSFVVTGLPVGTHWLVASKPGYEDKTVSFAVTRATITRLGNVELKPVGGQSMRSQPGACIRWTEGVAWPGGEPYPSGTYEFWYRPLVEYGTEYGTVVAEITRDYPGADGQGSRRLPAMQIGYRETEPGTSGETHLAFTFALADGGSADPDDPASYHTLQATTPMLLGHWYHLAAEYGPAGMKLFVDGHLEASSDYTGGPEPFDGAETTGWFSLGENYLDGQGRPHTSGGDFKGLSVGDSERYDSDFTPYLPPITGSDILIYDELIGTTNGENTGFVPTP